MKVASFNVNSIRSRLGLVRDWLTANKPDILCLQETKVQDKDFPAQAFHDNGYHVIFRGMKSYNGVAIVSLKEPLAVDFGFDDDAEPDCERLIRAEFNSITVVNTYIPQGRAPDSPMFEYKLEWFKRLGEYFDSHFDPQDLLLWLGDFNVAPEPKDVHDPVKLLGHVAYHPEAHKRMAEVVSWGFVDVFRIFHPEPGQFTFWDYRIPKAVERGIGWRVDHIMATRSLAERAVDSFVDVSQRQKEKPSDHAPLVAIFK